MPIRMKKAACLTPAEISQRLRAAYDAILKADTVPATNQETVSAQGASLAPTSDTRSIYTTSKAKATWTDSGGK